MADVKVKIIGEDHISNVLRSVDANLGKVGGNMKNMFGQMGQQSYNAISGTMGKLRDYGQQMRAIGSAAAEAALPIAMVGGAIIGVGAALKKSADDYMAYAQQVEDLANVIGGTPEEVSKLIQVADDVRISFETLQVAMVGAVRKGVDPSVEGLARLADAYNKLPEGAQRTKFLLDSFGRSGAEMARLMELGSAAITEMGNSIEGTSRLMTQEGIESAKAYYTALDTLGESAEDVGLAIGAKAAPAITEFANAMSTAAGNISGGGFFDLLSELKSLTSWSGEGKFISFTQYMGILKGYFTSGVNIADEIARIRAEAAGLGVDVSVAAVRMQDLTDAASDQGDAIRGTGDEWSAYWARLAETSRWEGMAKAAGKVTKAIEETGEAAEDAGKSLEDMFDFQIPDISSDIKGMMDGIKWKEIGGEAFEETFKAEMKRLYDWAPEGSLAMDTFADKADAVFAVLQAKMGELSEEDAIKKIAEALDKSTEEAKLLYDAFMKMDGLQLQIWLTTYMQTVSRNPRGGAGSFNPGTGNYTNPGGGTYTPYATGGTAYAGKGYMVGEQGPELFFPRSTGDVIPADQTAAMLGGGSKQYIDVTINAAPGMSPTAVAYQVIGMLAKRQNMSQLAGVGYAGA